MQGDINLNSKEKEGTSFVVYIKTSYEDQP